MDNKEAIKNIKEHCYFANLLPQAKEALDIAVQALEQKSKTGHWIKVHPLQADDEGAYMCSCCKVGDWNLKGTENFCPNCGVEMKRRIRDEV